MRNPFKREPNPFAAPKIVPALKSMRVRDHMQHWWQWAILFSLVLLLLGAGYLSLRFFMAQDRIRGNEDYGTDPKVEGEPFNALLVGSDSREGLTEEEQEDLGARAVPGERADTVILAHVDPASDSVVMVQFPRDLFVPIAGRGEDRINSALQDGQKTLVTTVENLTGLDIHQYAQVNIAGFRDLVDAIDGVDVCIPEPIPFDPNTGIEITEDEVGIVHFDGDEALRFVRSRNFFTGDFERIRNQQKFLAAAINKVISAGTLLRPDRILNLLGVAEENVRIDRNSSLGDLRDLAQKMRTFDPDRYEAYTVPNLGIGNVNGASVVLPDEGAIDVMFEAVARNESPAEADGVPNIAPSTIRVGVYNATLVDGVAVIGAGAAAASQLEGATDVGDGPVDVVEVTDTNRETVEVTTVRYREEARQMAELVHAAIPGSVLDEGFTPPGVDVSVLVGPDFQTKKIVQILPIPLPKEGDVPAVCRR